MLRITVLNDSTTTRFKLEGKLAHEWVPEAQKEWAALTVLNGKKKVTVDLSDVSFVDDIGWRLLAQMHHAGAKLVGSGLLISALIEEIEDAEAAEDATDSAGTTGKLRGA
jgi:anti-anti-sigma regulatory factor